jgi:hypothetical protein
MIVPKKSKCVFDRGNSGLTNGALAIDSDATEAETVRLQHNLLTDMSFLESFRRVVDANLAYNQFTVACQFVSLGSLAVLNLSHNCLAQIPNLLGTSVQQLDLSHNKITQIEGISSLKKLNTLNLSNNLISKVAEFGMQSPVI